MSPTYVYGVVAADTALPEGLHGVGPSGTVSLVADGKIAAVVGDVPLDRPLGNRDDLMAHKFVVDAIAGVTTVLPMRFLIDRADIEAFGEAGEALGEAWSGQIDFVASEAVETGA